MNSILFWLFCAQVCGVLVWGFRKSERLLLFPVPLSIGMLGFALPQMFSISYGPEVFPDKSVAKTLFFLNLCFAMAVLGFARPVTIKGSTPWHYSDKSLMWLGIALSAVGGVWYFKLTRLPDELLNQGQWRGLVVAYNFFASALPYGLVLCLHAALKTYSAAWLFVFLDVALLCDRAIIGGRRSAAVGLFLVMASALWLFRNYKLPRVLFGAIAFGGILLVNSIPDYRSAIGEGEAFSSVLLGKSLPLEKLRTIPYLDNLKEAFRTPGTEFGGAVFSLADCDAKGVFDFGLFHWDELIHNYVPAQLVGREFKESLKFKIYDNANQQNVFGYEKDEATAEPGIVDAFRSFWYFGSLKFYLIGLIMGTLLKRAREGSSNAQLGYIILLPPSLVIVSHSTQFFFSPILHMAIFMGVPLFLLKKKPRLLPPTQASGSRNRDRLCPKKQARLRLVDERFAPARDENAG